MVSDSNTLAANLLGHQGPFWDGINSRCGCRRIVLGAQEWSEHLAEVLRSAPGIAIVELPEPDVDGTLAWSAQDLFEVSVFRPLLVQIGEYDNDWEPGEPIAAQVARKYAAALLAAARAAETGADQ